MQREIEIDFEEEKEAEKESQDGPEFPAESKPGTSQKGWTWKNAVILILLSPILLIGLAVVGIFAAFEKFGETLAIVVGYLIIALVLLTIVAGGYYLGSEMRTESKIVSSDGTKLVIQVGATPRLFTRKYNGGKLPFKEEPLNMARAYCGGLFPERRPQLVNYQPASASVMAHVTYKCVSDE